MTAPSADAKPLYYSDASTIQNPYPMYARMRSVDPVHEYAPGQFALTRYADVVAVLKDTRFGRAGMVQVLNRMQGVGPGQSLYLLPMMFTDPPEHTRLRNVVGRAFTPRIVESLLPQIDRVTGELLDQLAGRDVFDVVHDLAYKLPVHTICYLLGIPREDHDGVHELGLAHASSLSAGPLNDRSRPIIENAHRLRKQWAEYVLKLAEERRVSPREDLISALVEKQNRDELSEEEFVGTIMGLLFAGHMTTTDSIGTGMYALLEGGREQWERLLREPKLLDSAVEEILRWEPAIAAYRRTTLEDAEIGGKPIAKGSIVNALSGAANRDPEVFADPERFDIARTPNKHLAFGSGIHFCMGAALGRAQIKAVIGALMQRFPRIELASSEPPQFRASGFRGYDRLDLRFNA